MNAYINLEDVSLKFRIYRNPTPSLKESFINKVFKKDHRVDEVLEFYALKNISLNIKGGDRLGIVGLNGAGKSTMLKTIAGIYTPHQGRISMAGQVTPLMELGAGFHPEQTGRDNIYLNGALLGHSVKDMQKREKAIIEFSELGEFIDLPVKYYSSGMYIRLAFSIATMTEPDILIMDEILSAGDAHFKQKASEKIKQLINVSQIVVLVSHNLQQIEEICNHAIVLHKGEMVNQGDPKEMVSYYLTEIAKAK
ncbi:hypothetical protein ADN00_06550 [Ornatilinea apprima]|uniref:ABC transporter domain-containing protein n=1 Tax=Ornatilinea apprima TaxID=1134406 RepID=A0A0P6XQ48_9CHLR|nr:hypothetical protein ADN00_06550 [Ornatilinea apprima]